LPSLPQSSNALPVQFAEYEVSGISSPENNFIFRVPKTDGYYHYTTTILDSSGLRQTIFIALVRHKNSVDFHYYITQPYHQWFAWDDNAHVTLGTDGTLSGELNVNLGDGNSRLAKYSLSGTIKRE
jgi:hypothetical protein